MKTVSYVCDRCGSTADEDAVSLRATRHRPRAEPEVVCLHREPSEAETVLCPACSESLVDWLNTKPTGGTSGGV